MTSKRAFILLFLGLAMTALAAVLFTQLAAAQSDPTQVAEATGGCLPGQGCPTQPGKSRPSKTPTDRPYNLPSKTPTPTETETPTVTSSPPPSNTAVPSETLVSPSQTSTAPVLTATSDRLMVVKTAGPPTTAPSLLPEESPPAAPPACFFCGFSWPWLLIGGALVIVAGFFLFWGPLSLGSTRVHGGTDPFPGGSGNATLMPPDLGGFESATLTVKDFGGGSESNTIPIRDFGGGFEGATISVSDPGGVNLGSHPGGVNLEMNPGNVNLGNQPGGVNHLPDMPGPGVNSH